VERGGVGDKAVGTPRSSGCCSQRPPFRRPADTEPANTAEAAGTEPASRAEPADTEPCWCPVGLISGVTRCMACDVCCSGRGKYGLGGDVRGTALSVAGRRGCGGGRIDGGRKAVLAGNSSIQTTFRSVAVSGRPFN
jgi:hypothetical protein